MKKIHLILLALTALACLCTAQDSDSSSSTTSTTPSSSTSTTTTSSSTSSTTTSTTTTPKPTKSPQTTKKPADCFINCQCLEKKLICEDAKLVAIPAGLAKSNYTKFYFRNNSIETVDFFALPIASIEHLDLSYNKIKLFNPKKDMPKLRLLNLRGNNITESITNTFIKFPALETLDLSQTKLKSIPEDAFYNLPELKNLNLTNAQLPIHLGDKQFAKNQKLELIDLSNNKFLEVPFALRSTSMIKTLILNENLMTSLRQSDFINRSSLVTLEVRRCPSLSSIDESAFGDLWALQNLFLTDNPKLAHFSKDAFRPIPDNPIKKELLAIDIRNNNISYLSNPLEWSSLIFEMINLDNNPWDCNCQIKWLSEYLANKTSLAHCKSPEKFRDMELSYALQTIDCDVIESSYHNIIVAGFLIFLIALAVAIFIQKGEYLKRLLWKDQYGSIYYTKARFPTDSL